MKKANIFKALMLTCIMFGASVTWSQVTFNYTGVVETYTVPAGVTSIRIETYGAQGGESTNSNVLGGLGAMMSADFVVVPGAIYDIAVGGQGNNDQYTSGGGGGTGVSLNSTPMIVSGGGAGVNSSGAQGGIDAVITTTAVDGASNPGSAGAAGGDGGDMIWSTVNFSRGGRGYNFGNTGSTGLDGSSTNGPTTNGVFGLGGGGGSVGSGYCNCGGGGGGYSGGGAGGINNNGGGGSSYNVGTNQTNTAGTNSGDGYVVITVLCFDSPSAFSVDVCDVYTVPSGDSTYVVSGVYNDTIPNATGCDSIMTITVNVTSLDLNTTTTDFTISADHASGTFQWINCSDNLPIAGETNQTFTATENGDYAVIITDGPCSDTSACATIAGVGINEINGLLSGVEIYPNPSNGQFYISSITNTVSVTVYSVDGKVIINNLMVNGENQLINLGNVETGIYFVEVSNDSNKETIRLIVK